jgi:hypothetical protein
VAGDIAPAININRRRPLLKLSEYLKKRNIPFESIKALSVRQPFASQIVTGEKTIEWRSKPLVYRGPLVICASASAKFFLQNTDGSETMLPVGVALGVVDVVGCRPFTKADLCDACCEGVLPPYDGYAWLLREPRECVPMSVKGIVAPWPWHNCGGHDLEIVPGWHEKNIFNLGGEH